MREQVDKPNVDNTQPKIEGAEKEQERLIALHEGWLKHPITIQLLNQLQKDFEQQLRLSFKDALADPDKPNTYVVQAAVYSKILFLLNNNTPYA